MENSVGTFRTDRLMQGDRPSQVTVNTGSTVLPLVIPISHPTVVHLHCILSVASLVLHANCVTTALTLDVKVMVTLPI